MRDQKPPRLEGDDRETLHTLLQFQRESLVRKVTLDAPCRGVDDGAPANLRWVLMHLLEETARHAGHADVLREMIDGQTGR